MAHFLYHFSYASNLKRQWLLGNCPSAVFVCIAKLDGYRISFCGYSESWKGAKATIIRSPGDAVWGAVWKLSPDHVTSIDSEEGVHLGVYNKLALTVTKKGGDEKFECITYARPEDVPQGAPSPQYLQTILEGARECDLPQDYIEELSKVEHNGYSGTLNLSNNYAVV